VTIDVIMELSDQVFSVTHLMDLEEEFWSWTPAPLTTKTPFCKPYWVNLRWTLKWSQNC